MICTPQFIKVYNAIFKYVDKHFGFEGVIGLWEDIAPVVLNELKNAACDGLEGCRNYWYKTLTAEDAKCKIEIIEDTLIIDMHECPSISILGDSAYENYCSHCIVMYKEILEPMGFRYELKNLGKGKCRITVSK